MLVNRRELLLGTAASIAATYPAYAALPQDDSPSSNKVPVPQYIVFNGKLNDGACSGLMQAIRGVSLQNQNMTLVLSSSGGDWDSGLTLYSYILSLRDQNISLTIQAWHLLRGVSSFIFLAADKRVACPDTKLVLGPIEAQNVAGNYNIDDLKDSVDDLNIDVSIVKDICKSRTSLSDSQIKELISHPLYLSVSEAQQYGIVRQISELRIPPEATVTWSWGS
jgi:ATP-dependent protease ClpP protease subunit